MARMKRLARLGGIATMIVAMTVGLVRFQVLILG